jgi:hypothetical protein
MRFIDTQDTNFMKMKKASTKINREWHEKHRMPPNATTQQQIEWHLEHAKHCSCRPIPEKLKER